MPKTIVKYKTKPNKTVYVYPTYYCYYYYVLLVFQGKKNVY